VNHDLGDRSRLIQPVLHRPVFQASRLDRDFGGPARVRPVCSRFLNAVPSLVVGQAVVHDAAVAMRPQEIGHEVAVGPLAYHAGGLADERTNVPFRYLTLF